jgi:hypothetical protein
MLRMTNGLLIENQDGCRLKSKQGSDYAGVPRPASARFRSAICPAW